MSEENFADKVVEKLREALPNFKVGRRESLLYKLIVDPEGKLNPADYSNPKRGDLAFQTDILIRNDRIPLVVIETKFGRYDTHNILTYSAKALKHKEVYPYLRYGLILGNNDKIHTRFFTHNVGFDFALAIPKECDDFKDLVEIVKKQIEVSELIQSFLKGKTATKYMSTVEVE